MMTSANVFEFATAGRILFGEGELSKVGSLAAEFGKRAFIAVGHLDEAYSRLEQRLAEQGVTPIFDKVDAEPTVDSVRTATDRARQASCDLVIGFGGGSAMDTAKAVGAMLANPGDLTDYLEVIGRGHRLSQPSAPVLAIPTTAGTGSEVTRNAVIGSHENRVKVSLRSASMLPKVALVDPELTYNLPSTLTASTGLDALTQLIEPFVSIYANPLTDSLCREGIRRASRALPVLAYSLEDHLARREMCLASLFGGLALANAKLGAVHGFAGVIGGMVPSPHGAVCARLLPLVMAANIQALEARGQSETLGRYQEVAAMLTGEPQASPQEGVAWVSSLIDRLQIPSLGSYGLVQADIPDVVEKAERSSSMSGNPVQLNRDTLAQILLKAI